MNILIAALFLLVPAPIIWLNNRFKAVEKIGIVLICYLLGILVGNIGILPESFSGIQTTMQDVSICLALPLILFSVDIKKWMKTAKKGIICMLLAVVSIATVVFILQLIFRDNPEASKYAGLAIGVYTGGTPNIASIKTAIGVDETTYTIFNTYDMVISIFYMLLVTSGARKVIIKIFKLKPFEGDKNISIDGEEVSTDSETSYKGFFKPAVFGKICLAFLLSAAIVGVSYVAGTFVKGYETAVTILLITTLSIACSFIKPVRSIKRTSQAGMYIIYVFCFTVATMSDISKFIKEVLFTIMNTLMVMIMTFDGV